LEPILPVIENPIMYEQLGLIGCGLMGSSFALALKRAGLVKRVVGFSPSKTTTELALKMGVIDAIASSAAEAATGADLILLAVPVAATEATLSAIQPALTATALVMDVGSTKRDVVNAALQTLGNRLPCFVPAHPICGREVSGVKNAIVDLYVGEKLILTPLPETDPDKLAQARQIWAALGCNVSEMSPQTHDAAYAAVSHLPHLLAFAMMNSLGAQAEGNQYLSLAGPGFRDFTRIAAAEPVMWRDILLANRDELLAQSRQFQAHLQALEKLIETGDAASLQASIHQASQARASWQHTPAVASK
jgi:prephenate dehydrogenase